MTKTSEFVASWTAHRQALLELLDVFESSQLQYKPWDKAMSVSELVLHTSGATLMFVNTIQNGVLTPPTEITVETIEDLKKTVQEQTEQTKVVAESLSEEQLNQTIDFFGTPMPGFVLLQLAKDHEVHHKGQLFTYARLLGAETLPNFIKR